MVFKQGDTYEDGREKNLLNQWVDSNGNRMNRTIDEISLQEKLPATQVFLTFLLLIASCMAFVVAILICVL